MATRHIALNERDCAETVGVLLKGGEWVKVEGGYCNAHGMAFQHLSDAHRDLAVRALLAAPRLQNALEEALVTLTTFVRYNGDRTSLVTGETTTEQIARLRKVIEEANVGELKHAALRGNGKGKEEEILYGK